ncbi:uncharacterized protein BO97DRAFT_216425 [Aspergillus homomorphus CBS 101889]|uniref:Uncharacterized protein n=1 Tax=Aspergillus homomorphus (strain CBS 101889) TaxID=1450537 RepID=A0A395I5R2_ASPHC|nr:hypothetical protein BO97DRAFT_216425 [Aspergillus homomorphus CBS 101889]RAL15572.1 hypothetical protein BO97DRAFT_216425 [Aspergillus homomorphus CBS 101889]
MPGSQSNTFTEAPEVLPIDCMVCILRLPVIFLLFCSPKQPTEEPHRAESFMFSYRSSQIANL